MADPKNNKGFINSVSLALTQCPEETFLAVEKAMQGKVREGTLKAPRDVRATALALHAVLHDKTEQLVRVLVKNNVPVPS